MELPEPHDYRGHGLHSYRRHRRAHHRIEFRPTSGRYKRLTVHVPVAERPAPATVWQWYRLHDGSVRFVHHYAPDAKLDKWLNQRMQDTKAFGDTSALAGLSALSYRRADYVQGMSGAVRQQSPQQLADTALALVNAR